MSFVLQSTAMQYTTTGNVVITITTIITIIINQKQQESLREFPAVFGFLWLKNGELEFLC